MGGSSGQSVIKPGAVGTAGTSTQGTMMSCDEQTEPARLTPVNIVFIIDKSGSMGVQDVNNDGVIDDQNNEWDHSAERWNPVRDTLIAFFQNPGSQGLKASLEFFPQGGQPTGPDTGVCRTAEYASPSVPLQSLDESSGPSLLITKINATKPGGGTPTLPAVSGALQYAAKLMTDDPSSRSAVVLVTDGEPGVADKASGTTLNEKCFCFREPGCPDQDEIPHVVEAVQAGAKSGIPTYVIGMSRDVDPTNLNMIAVAGGTDHAFIIDELGTPQKTQEELRAVLESVRSVQPPCNILMPKAPTGETFEKQRVNVEYVSSSGEKQPLYYAGPLAAKMGGSQLSCPNAGPPAPANPWFWSYDDEDNPTQIVLCKSACNMTSGDASGRVNVAYGCVIRIK